MTDMEKEVKKVFDKKTLIPFSMVMILLGGAERFLNLQHKVEVQANALTSLEKRDIKVKEDWLNEMKQVQGDIHLIKIDVEVIKERIKK